MTGKFGKILGMALAVCMIVSCLTGFGKEEVKAAQTPVKYLDYNESSKSFEENICNAYSVVGTTTTSMTGQDSWYVVNGEVTVSGRISVTGTVNLILMNGCKLTASQGIGVNEGNTLRIYRQARSEGTTTTPGELVATGITDSAGIGGGRSGGGGNITINGGTITATGGQGGAGIGGGERGAGGNITINGGTVTATSTTGGGAGIGGGDHGAGGNITINGGTVTATGRYGGAGIGGGEDGAGGNITINGGTVTATLTSMGGGGAGIGGGCNGAGGSIEINGGTVTAVFHIGGGAGIGGGGNGAGGSIEINGGTVTAEIGGGGAGIGGGMSGTGGHIEINGGTITAFSDQGSGIGKGMTGRGTGTYSLGTGMKGFSSASENSDYSSLSGSFGDTDKYVIIYKNESGFLTASGNVITAKYVNESRNIQSAELGITAPAVEEIIFGDTEKNRAKLDRCDVFNTALGRTESNRVSESQIKYYNSDGQELESAPTAKGSYTAKINVDGVTAAVDYTIIKEDPQITHPTAGNLMYRNSLQELVSGGSVTGGTLLYSFSETGDYTTEIPKERDIGSYTVYYKVIGNEGYKDSITYQLSVSIQKANLNLSLSQENWVKGDTAPDPVLSGNEVGGAVTYAYKKQSEDDAAYVSAVPTEAGNYVVRAIVAETGNYLGGTVTAEFTITEPEYALPTAIQNLIYTENPQRLVNPGSVSGGAISYSLTEDGIYSGDIPIGTEAGDYIVYYKVIGRDGVTTVTGSSITVLIAKKNLELTLSQAGWVKGSTAPGPVLSGNEGSGAVTYAYKKQSEDNTAYVDNAVPTETGNYVVRATVAETGNYFGGIATAEFSITEPASGQNPDQSSGSDPTPAPAPQPVYIPAEPVREGTKAEAENYTKIVVNPDGTISEISVTKLKDGSIITSETVRDKDGKFVEYKYEYTRTAKNGTTCVKSFNKKADGSQNETFVTTTKSGTVSTVVKEVTADGTAISKEGKSYADGRTSIKEAITGSDGVTKVITEKTDAAGNGVWAEYTAIKDDARGDEGTNASGTKGADISGVEGADASGAAGADTKNRALHKAMKVFLTTAEVIGTTFKIPGEIWVNEQHFIVTEIAKNLLKNNKTVTKLTIGENITKIGASAFRNMTGLKKITINAANLEEIGKNAFKGVGDKKTVTITVKAETEEEFEKICEMIRAAGIGKKVRFVKVL